MITEECRYKESGGAFKGGGGCCRATAPQIEIKKTDFVDTMISKGLCDLPFIPNQTLKSIDD
jgi:hypothetical protein